MPRNHTSKEIHTPKNRLNRVAERINGGHGLIDAEQLEKIGYDEAQSEADVEAVTHLLAFLEKRSGHEADLELSKKLHIAGFSRVRAGIKNQGEWQKDGVLLRSPQGKKLFGKHARLLASQESMRHVQMLLDGSAYVRGTPADFRLAMLIAFEAGIEFAVSEKLKNAGRRKADKFDEALNALFSKTVKSASLEMSTKSIYPAIDLKAVAVLCSQFRRNGKPIEDSTLQNKIGNWLRSQKQTVRR